MTAGPMPGLDQIAPDLLATTRRQRWIALARPYVGVVAFGVLVWLQWWLVTPLVMFGIFVAVVTVTHDVVHRSLGLSRRQSEWALFLLGAVLLESGHAYRSTHLQHHRVFPSEDDPEGYPANLSLLGAVCYGPVFLVRLWWWAFVRARGQATQRAWLLAEACVPFAVVGAGVALLPVTGGVLLYAVMAIAGSWVYPLLTVYLPHHDYGEEPITQTRTLRGRLIPAVFLELTYHLEHHLYPKVPSHHLAELARRADPYLAAAGVVPRKVP